MSDGDVGSDSPRRIAVLTTTRADYGLLYWLIDAVQRRTSLELQLIVSGTHLSPEFGLTVKAIEADGIPITARCDIVLSGDTPAAICTSTGLGMIKFGDVFQRLRPAIVVLLGDRYEVLAAATAALICRVPIAHCHGGEVTEGVIDEAIRHAVTKMSSLHFTATERYARRVIQLGEATDRVYTVGALAIENLRRLTLRSRATLEQTLGLPLTQPLFVVTYHPTTLSSNGSERPVRELLTALDHFSTATIIFSKSNADTDGRIINELIQRYAAERPDRVRVCDALGSVVYMSLVRAADVIVGNSSSGIIEAPLLGTPTVNLGDRQRGRLRTGSIIDCEENCLSIVSGLKAALDMDRTSIAACGEALYGSGGGVQTIVDVLETVDVNGLGLKTFNDLRVQ